MHRLADVARDHIDLNVRKHLRQHREQALGDPASSTFDEQDPPRMRNLAAEEITQVDIVNGLSTPQFDLGHFLGYNRTMKQVNMHDAKTHLSRYIAELEPGEKLILCNRNQPVAEIRPIASTSKKKPRIGVAKGNSMCRNPSLNPCRTT